MALIKVSNIPTTAIANQAITSDKIADGAVTATDLHTTAVTDKLGFTPVTNARTLTINGTSYDLTANRSWTIQTGITWDTIKTSNFTAVANYGYFVNTTSGAITVTLPASPAAGATISIVDYAGTSATNNIILAGNGSNINGQAANVLILTNREALTLVYVDATQGWIPLSDVYSSSVPISLPYTVDYLIVAGGGGGGPDIGGGGGAGGYLAGSTTVSSGVSYSLVIGAGSAQNTQGTNSTGFSLTAIGGGHGSGGNGGSGGGCRGNGAFGLGTAGQGNNGNKSTQSQDAGAGGGGGAGAAGGLGNNSASGNGGVGLNWQSLGTFYAGGGGGGGYSTFGVAAGSGGNGGGANGLQSGQPSAATANRGGGGGGGGVNSTGGTGGSGIVIVRYSGSQRGTGGTITSSGGYTYHTFTSSGTYTA